MLNELYLTGILRTMREEAETAERREEDISPAALVQYAQMIEDSVYKGDAAMTYITTSDYGRQLQVDIQECTHQIEQMELIRDSFCQIESLFKVIGRMLDENPEDQNTDAALLALTGRELAKRQAEHFMDSAGSFEATRSGLDVEFEAWKESTVFAEKGRA